VRKRRSKEGVPYGNTETGCNADGTKSKSSANKYVKYGDFLQMGSE